MNMFQCPGSVSIREPIPEFFKCPTCGAEVEIWTHEQSRNCEKCGFEVFKEHVPTCVEWCAYAKDCVGEDAYNRYMKNKETNKGDSDGKKTNNKN
jgi:DNA-directed RNA polymerase subunit RPC12/RpoP